MSLKVMKTLVVVDLQKDFYSPEGALYVKGGERLPAEVGRIIERFDNVIFTLDWHPVDHCSFKAQGGPWPMHCVAYSEGASLPLALLTAAPAYDIYRKGKDASREEYGAFAGEKRVETIKAADEVVVCGIAGDYCVLETLRNIVALRDSTLGIKVFVQGVASIDGGKALADYMSQTGIEEYIA